MRTIHWMGLLALVVLWGGAYSLIDEALVSGWSPSMLNAVRYGFGAVLIGGWLLVRRPQVLIDEFRRDPKRILLVGTVSSVVPATALTYGQSLVSSGLAGTLIASMAVWTIVIQHTLFDHRHHRGEYVGVGIGLLGVLVMYLPGLSSGSSLLGITLITLAAISYALGAVLAERLYDPTDGPALIASSTCLVTSLASLGIGGVTGDLHTGTWWPVLILGLGSIVAALLLYYWLIQQIGPAKTMLNAYVAPAFALGLAAVRGEHLAVSTFVGGAIILVAVVVATWPDITSADVDEIDSPPEALAASHVDPTMR